MERPERTLREPVYLERFADVIRVYSDSGHYEFFLMDSSGDTAGGISPEAASEISFEADSGRVWFCAVIGTDTLIISERRVAYEATYNMRDLGGLVTKDGYQVKWGKLYRSDQLHKVKKKHFAELEPLGIKTICDFRLPRDQKKKPDRWPGIDTIRNLSIPIGDGNVRGRQVLKKLKDENYDAEDHLTQSNHNYVVEYKDEFQMFFEALLEKENYPFLYHCTAGKDRTGFASAMILSALNVDRQLIIDEYMMTNYYAHEHIEKNARLGARLLGIDQDKLRALAGVRLRYIEEAFATIEQEYDTVEHYLCQALHVCDREIEALKRILLYGYAP